MYPRFCSQWALVILALIICCRAKNWMYSKTWIEDYRTEVKYGLPYQRVPTEYSLETHKIGVVQREEERYLDEGSYDYRESSTVLRKMKDEAVHNKGEKHSGQLISDVIIVPKNITHALPSLRVDIVLLEKVSDETINFIGLLESPKNDGYSSFSSSIRKTKRNSSISYEFVLCGNYRRKDMRSIGFVDIRYDMDSDHANLITRDAAVIDPYLFMVVIKSIVIDDKSLATCEELNVRGAIFDNTVPGIYLPFVIFQRVLGAMNDHADEHNFPMEMKIWRKRKHVCFEGPVNWNYIPGMRVDFFAKENEAVAVSYSGHSLVQRYYTKNSGKRTFCYIFAIRKSNDESLTFGRSAFEGVRLIFNRTRGAISFLENTCCGPRIKVRSVRETKEKMSLCLPESLRATRMASNSNWIWFMVAAIILAILACLLSIPKSFERSVLGPPAIHIFVAQSESENVYVQKELQTNEYRHTEIRETETKEIS